jgi:hypothetical protein
MNPFMADYKTRQHAWKQVRDHIQQATDLHHKLDITLKFWSQAPEESVRINWDDCASWPDPWELMHENAYCVSCHSLGIAYTLQLADPVTFNDVSLRLLWDKPNARQRIVVHTHDHYLNWYHVDKLPVHQLKTAITQNVWHWQHRQWHSTRPK